MLPSALQEAIWLRRLLACVNLKLLSLPWFMKTIKWPLNSLATQDKAYRDFIPLFIIEDYLKEIIGEYCITSNMIADIITKAVTRRHLKNSGVLSVLNLEQ